MWKKYKRMCLASLWLIALILIKIEKNQQISYFVQPRLVMCDVGQGDAILITQGEKQILVDGGPDGKVLKCLAEEMPENDLEIDLIILTHPDLDHFGGLREVLKEYRIKEIMLNNLGKNSSEFIELYNLIEKEIENEGTKIESPALAQKWCETERLCLEIIWLSEKTLPENIFSYKYDNNYLSDMLTKFEQFDYDYNDGSIVVVLNLDQKKFLLTGDIGKASELAMVHNGLLSKIDVLKIAHHGSKNSSDPIFLATVRPEISLISVGKSNSFDHPAKVVTDHLKEINSQIYRTDKQGKVTVTVESSKLVIRTELDES